MNFKSGDEEVLWGVYMIDYIKEHHPYIACVVASGEKALPDDVLDLRDEHQLDYYYVDELPARPDIVHYFGHGIYRDREGFLLFDDGMSGRDLVSAKRLAAALGDVRLIVIHACQSAMVEDAGSLLTGVAPALSIVTGAVVAMQLSVRTDAATRFTQVFVEGHDISCPS